jgi:hypothetical protein
MPAGPVSRHSLNEQMKNFVIVGTQRTGSSALAESIGLHPAVACGWEWSLRVPWHLKIAAPEKAFRGDFSLLADHEREHMERIFSEKTVWLGYRSLFRSSDKWLIAPKYSIALLADRFHAYLRWLSQQADLHIVHIVRRDNIEWLKSKFVSSASNSYVGKEYPEDLKISIPISASVKRLLSKDWVDNRLRQLSQTNPYLLVRYEDFLENRQRVLAEALQFLSLDAQYTAKREPRISKQSAGDASRYISNYSVLRETLANLGLLTSSVPG